MSQRFQFLIAIAAVAEKEMLNERLHRDTEASGRHDYYLMPNRTETRPPDSCSKESDKTYTSKSDIKIHANYCQNCPTKAGTLF